MCQNISACLKLSGPRLAIVCGYIGFLCLSEGNETKLFILTFTGLLKVMCNILMSSGIPADVLTEVRVFENLCRGVGREE